MYICVVHFTYQITSPTNHETQVYSLYIEGNPRYLILNDPQKIEN